MAEQVKLAEFEIDLSSVIKDTQDLKVAIDALKVSQDHARKAGEQNSEQYIKNEAALKSLSSEYSKNITALSQTTAAKTQALTVEDQAILRSQRLAAALGSEATSIQSAREQNKALTSLREQSNVSTEKGQKEVALLNDKINQNNALIKQNSDALSQQKQNVGNYTESIKGALNGVLPFNGAIGKMSEGVESAGGVMPALSQGLSGVIAGIRGATMASLAFLATPIGAVVGAIGLALGLVVNALTSTQSGMDKVTAVTRPLTAILDAFFGVAQNLGTGLIEAFSSPKQLLIDLYEFVKNNLINRFTAFGEILEGIINLDFQQLADGVLQATTGVEGLTGKITDAAKATTDLLSEAVETGKELNRLTIAYEEIQNRNIELIPQLTAELKKQNLIAENITKTQAEREAATLKTLELNNQITAAKKEEINLELAIAENEKGRRTLTRAELGEIAKIKAKRDEADSANFELQTTQQNKLNGIRKEQETAQLKAADDKITKDKELLDLYIAEQGVKARTMSEELILSEEISKRKKEILEDELSAKKISEEAYRRSILELDQDLSQARAEIAVENAQKEIDIQMASLAKKREIDTYLTDQLAEQKRIENENLLLQQQQIAALQLEQGLINQTQYNEAVTSLNEENRISNQEIAKEREALSKEELATSRQIEFDERLAKMQEEGAGAFALEQERIAQERSIQRSHLDEDKSKGLISEEIYQSKINQINENARRADLRNTKALAQQKLAVTQNILSGISELIGKESDAGKAVAVASSLINTYMGITSALGAPWPLAIPAAVVAGAVGFKSVHDILATNPKGETSVKGSTPSLASDSASLGRNQSNVSAISASGNAAVQQQLNASAQGGGMVEAVGNAVKQGSKEGTAQGSEQGLTNLSDNKKIMESSNF